MAVYRLPDRFVRNYGVRGHVRAFKSGDMSPHSKYQRVLNIRLFGFLVTLLMIMTTSIFAAGKNGHLPQLPGYKAVPVHYGPLNKMIMSVQINGQPANLLVDTGSNEIILDADAAESFGVRPSQRGLRYIGFTEISGQLLPVGFAQTLTAGSMSFGSSPVVLRNSSRSDTGQAHVDGVLGLQTLFRHKAVINCRTKFVFLRLIERVRRSWLPLRCRQNSQEFLYIGRRAGR